MSCKSYTYVNILNNSVPLSQYIFDKIVIWVKIIV